jgi:SAM-dependent methyltransferase
MSSTVTNFYDHLSLLYHHNMGWDWDDVVRKEGAQLHRFLTERMGCKSPISLLDCSCGIGTQAIGLALEGHRVQATDLSEVSIDCARQEAESLRLNMSFAVADYRNLGAVVSDTFDVVLSCDNSISHCLEDDDLAAALTSIKGRLNPDGVLLVSVRDYDALVRDRPRFNNQHVQDKPDGRRIVFQVWDWDTSGRHYRIHQFLIRKIDDDYQIHHFETKLRALLRDELLAAVRDEGYEEVQWLTPAESGYYQPMVTARSQ